MNTKESERLFQTIVNTLLSPYPVRADVIQQSVADYAKSINVPYDRARQAVVWAVQSKVNSKLRQL